MLTRIITLLTDFGTEDYFVAAMKGVILTRSPNTLLVDITHAIPPQDVRAAAFTLNAAYQNFPAGSIHLAVVDLLVRGFPALGDVRGLGGVGQRERRHPGGHVIDTRI